MHGVEKLCRLGGLHGHAGKAGQKCGESRDVPRCPAGARHVLAAQPHDEHHARHGYDVIDGLHGVFPHVGGHRPLFVIVQLFFVGLVPVFLPAIHPVCQRVGQPVHSGVVQRAGAFFVCRRAAVHGFFQSFRYKIRRRGKGRRDERQPPVIVKQHGKIGDKRHAGIEDLGGEFAHTLGAGVHIRHGSCHGRAHALPLQSLPRRVDKAVI